MKQQAVELGACAGAESPEICLPPPASVLSFQPHMAMWGVWHPELLSGDRGTQELAVAPATVPPAQPQLSISWCPAGCGQRSCHPKYLHGLFSL